MENAAEAEVPRATRSLQESDDDSAPLPSTACTSRTVPMSLSDLDFLHQTLAAQSRSEPRDRATGESEQPSPDRPRDATDDGDGDVAGARDPPTQSLAALVASLQATTDSTTAALESTRSQRDDEGEGEDEEVTEAELERMLAKLNEAEGAADDLEGRLDGLIGNLDQMLSLLGVDPRDLEPHEDETDVAPTAGPDTGSSGDTAQGPNGGDVSTTRNRGNGEER
ncbi:hypothetical protein JCM11491_002428 [Sporobolomyces phaffii]